MRIATGWMNARGLEQSSVDPNLAGWQIQAQSDPAGHLHEFAGWISIGGCRNESTQASRFVRLAALAVGTHCAHPAKRSQAAAAHTRDFMHRGILSPRALSWRSMEAHREGGWPHAALPVSECCLLLD
jgi:hypothetical protein